jgi:DNA-binding HxlR family transcriptional regulator
MDRRSYNQFCGLAHSLDVVGERWTLLIVRNLLLGPLRYSELLRGLPGITTNLLAKRLREMEALGLIEHVRAGGSDGYRLTPVGAALEPAIHALGRWGWQWMDAPKKGEIRNVEWLFVALRRRYLGGATLRAEIVADDAPYRVILSGEAVEISRGDVPAADLRVRGPALSIARMFLDASLKNRAPDEVEVEGTAADLRALLAAFAKGERRS